MAKFLCALALSAMVASGVAQTKYIDRGGKASFFSAALVEDIEAHNNQAVSIVDIETGELVASMLMKSFNFKKALMQEHFNENYIESNKFPKAIFRGKITNLGQFDVSKNGKYIWEVSGDMTIHGVTKPLNVKANALVENGLIRCNAVFALLVKDFKIEIPKLVRSNIAEEVEVSVSFIYQPLASK